MTTTVLTRALPALAHSAERTRREQAIDAAARVFAQHGYHGAGTRAIADLLGIKVASLYFHFRSKEEALEEVCLVGIEQPAVYLRIAYAEETAFDRRIHRFLTDYSEHLSTQSDYITVFQNERRYLLPEATARLNAAARPTMLLFDQIFSDAQAEGVMDTTIPLRMARLILIGVLRNITQFRLAGPIVDFESFVRHSGDHFLRGMAPPGR
jgi:TetR/AcrR family transcriptional regulator, cholesterol catabolism regulator